MGTRTRSGEVIRRGFTLLAGLLIAILGPVRLYPQVVGGTVSGMIISTSGDLIPGVQVSIKNAATGVTTVVATNSVGIYDAPNLSPGIYDITIAAPGFESVMQTGVTLTVGGQQALNLALIPGTATQAAQQGGTLPAVQLTTSSLSAVVDSTTVRELPLNGRDWTQLATLYSGVAAIVTQQPLGVNAPRAARGYGNALTISGGRPQQNNYRLDGLSINDYSNGAPGSVEGVNLGVDAVEEFSILTSNYDASYGRASGGVINAISRSGTNVFHGDLYEFIRNDNVDARNFVESAIGHFVRNQFGGSAGGPIRKDKTFIYGDFEGLRQSHELPSPSAVPTPAARAGNLCGGSVKVDATAAKFLAFYPLPTGVLPPGPGQPGCSDSATHNFDAANLTSENYVITHVDHHISEKDSLVGTFMWDRANTTAPDSFNLWLDGNKTFRGLAGLEERHVFSPSLTNSLRLGYSRVVGTSNTPVGAINPLAADTSFGVFPGQTAPGVAVSGLGLMTGGLESLANFVFVGNSYQLYDDAFLTRGSHSVKFGGAYEAMEENETSNLQPTGLWTFPSLEDFLTNDEDDATFIGALPGSQFPRGQRAKLFAGYMQDDWRLRSNLTLNLGMRYEMLTNPYAVDGKTVNLDFPTNPSVRTGGNYFHSNPTLANFEPRAGFAWDPLRNGKTAVRGGIGVYDVLPLLSDFQQMINLSAPFYRFGTVATFPGSGTGFFNTGVGALAEALGQSALQTSWIEPDPRRNYVLTWTLSIQRQLAPSANAEIAYVGNHGVHMPNREDDMNSVIPMQTPAGLLFPSPGSGTRLNPNWGAIRGIYWSGDSFYDALESRVTKTIGHGFQGQLSYTWSKAIDTGSASVIGDPFQNSISSPFFFCKSCRRGLADFNIGQNLSANFLWSVPAPKTGKGARWAGSGWEVGGIVTAQSGLPTTPLIGGDTMGLNSSDPYSFAVRLPGPGCSTGTTGNINSYFNLSCFGISQTPNLMMDRWGRNSIIGPNLVNLDLSVYKNNYVRRISESFNLQFRAEFFNVLNHPSFLPPLNSINNQIFDGSQSGIPLTGVAGNLLLSGTSTQPRQIQFALKLNW
jgi:Carboxypeptidase regulatory-like domain/TonB-dependent Receptor Plug Domain